MSTSKIDTAILGTCELINRVKNSAHFSFMYKRNHLHFIQIQENTRDKTTNARKSNNPYVGQFNDKANYLSAYLFPD